MKALKLALERLATSGDSQSFAVSDHRPRVSDCSEICRVSTPRSAHLSFKCPGLLKVEAGQVQRK